MYIVGLNLRIKYDGSRNRNNCAMRKIWIVGFDSIKNLPSNLCLIFFFSMWLNLMYCFILSLRIKYYDSKNQNNFFMRTISIVVLIRSKIYVTSEFLLWSKEYVTRKLSFVSYWNQLYLFNVFMWMPSYKNKCQSSMF